MGASQCVGEITFYDKEVPVKRTRTKIGNRFPPFVYLEKRIVIPLSDDITVLSQT